MMGPCRCSGRSLRGCFLWITALAFVYSYGQVFPEKKKFVSDNLPKTAVYKMRTIVLGEDRKKELTAESGIQEIPDTLVFIIGRDKNNALTGAVCICIRILERYNEYHQVGIALLPDGKVKRIALIGVHGEYPSLLATRAFYSRFAGRKPDRLVWGRDIDAVSGATMSARLVAETVIVAATVFDRHIKEQK